jgi:hypothetical protein
MPHAVWVNLGVHRAEFIKISIEVVLPSVEQCRGVGVDHSDVFEAIYRQAWNAIGVAVKEAIRRQVRPLRQRRALTDGVSDRTRPGD